MGVYLFLAILAGTAIVLWVYLHRPLDPEKILRAEMSLNSVSIGTLVEKTLGPKLSADGVGLIFALGPHRRSLNFNYPLVFDLCAGDYSLDEDSNQLVIITLNGAGFTRAGTFSEVYRALEAALRDEIKKLPPQAEVKILERSEV